MEENPNEPEPESPIKITVTDDDTGQEVDSISDPKNDTEQQKEPEKPAENQNGTPGTMIGTSATADKTPESLSTKDLVAGRRESVALQEMDKQHAWLSEIEEKSANLETAFISKIQYVALSNHYKKFIDELQEKETDSSEVVGEFVNLFNKFRTCFVGSQRLHNKLMEMRTLKSLVDSENRKLKSRIYEMEMKEGSQDEHVEDLKLQVTKRDKEKALLQQEVSGIREELRSVEQRLDSQESNFKMTNIAAKGDDTSEYEEKIRNLMEELESLKTELSFSQDREVIFQDRLAKADQVIASLKTDLNGARSELLRQTALREKAEAMVVEGGREMEEEKEVVMDLEEELRKVKSELESCKSDYKDVLKDLREIKKKFDATSNTLVKAQRDVNIRDERLKTCSVERETILLELNDKQMEIKALKVDISSANKQQKEFTRKISILEANAQELESKLDSQLEISNTQQKRIEALESELTENRKEIKRATKEKEELTVDVLKLENTISNQLGEIKTGTENLLAVNKELESSRLKIEELEDVIKHQERAKERIATEVLEQKKTISNLKNEFKRIELQVSESEKIIEQLRQELNEQLAKYKKVTDDEKFYRKSVAESKRTIEQQNEQLNMLNKYIQQLKSYNQDLDDKRKKLFLQNKDVSGKLGYVKESLKQEKKNVESLTAKLVLKDNEEQSLLKRITSLDEEIHSLQRKLKNIIEEKDVLSTKLKEKDEVISSNKDRILQLDQELTLMKKSLEERMDDVKLLKLQLSEMHRSRALMEVQVENMESVREELTKTQGQLQEKNFLLKGMEAEMQRPMNVHRWRILEGTDPDRAHLLAKTQTLQKQMIKNRESLLAKETELREKDEMIANLHNMLRRRSDDSVNDQLEDCRRELRARINRLKCLAAENNMYENLVRKYKDETTALKDELRKCKLAEFEKKSKPKRKSGDW